MHSWWSLAAVLERPCIVAALRGRLGARPILPRPIAAGRYCGRVRHLAAAAIVIPVIHWAGACTRRTRVRLVCVSRPERPRAPGDPSPLMPSETLCAQTQERVFLHSNQPCKEKGRTHTSCRASGAFLPAAVRCVARRRPAPPPRLGSERCGMCHRGRAVVARKTPRSRSFLPSSSSSLTSRGPLRRSWPCDDAGDVSQISVRTVPRCPRTARAGPVRHGSARRRAVPSQLRCGRADT